MKCKSHIQFNHFYSSGISKCCRRTNTNERTKAQPWNNVPLPIASQYMMCDGGVYRADDFLACENMFLNILPTTGFWVT